MIISAQIISGMRHFAIVRPCAQINSVLGRGATSALYPSCKAFFQGDTGAQAIVQPDFNSDDPMEITVSMSVGFGAAGFIALWLHVIAVELYVSDGCIN